MYFFFITDNNSFRNLPSINDRKPNSYVKVIIDNDKSEKNEKRKRKTVVQRNNSNPVYDKRF